MNAIVPLANVVPPIASHEHLVRNPAREPAWTLPIPVPAFDEHVRNFDMTSPEGTALAVAVAQDGSVLVGTSTGMWRLAASGTWEPLDLAGQGEGPAAPQIALSLNAGKYPEVFRKAVVDIANARPLTALAVDNAGIWFSDGQGLYSESPGSEPQRHVEYGINGPASTAITGLACDSRGTLWVGTPIGLSRRTPDGVWTSLRGRDGLPVEDVTALAIDASDRLWIGTSRGLVLYLPYAEGRQWFYRAGERYLPGNRVAAVAVTPDGRTVYTATDKGLGRLDTITTTLLERAQTIERLVNERHRRLGMVATCLLDDAEHPSSHTIHDNDNDGLWTAYHVAAMSLCYGATHDESAKASARESMHALYMLQNASGIPGVVARSVLPPDMGSQKDLDRPEPQRQWQRTPDGAMYWKSDTSSDEIDGHYLAFYAYYEHIAQHDPEEKALIQKQVRDVTDYLIKNNYQLIDWNGKRTRWGFWNPEAINEDASNFLENGLNSLQMLSFLKTAHYVTGDEKYAEHYRKLIVKHGYLSNVLLTKKLFPDDNNHSDDQLGFVAWYPILQLEHDPVIREALHAAVRRHYKVVAPEKSSFYTFVFATVAPNEALLDEAIENLREIPTDRRTWVMDNSERDDVRLQSRANRFGKPVLDRALPMDERTFKKWNDDPYSP
ncbi:MAG: hypothetical protein IT364_20685, partial [Candidatus Hydrogenedentes bacterium]|nr:hypothetical protein [Candidatus Hydrogenedentota bacterium]